MSGATYPKVLTAAEMRALEESAFARGISAEALMEQAGERCADAIRELCPVPGECIAVFGKGNNGGDALVIARHLAHAGWKTHLVPAFPREVWGELPRRKFEEAGLGQHYAPGPQSVLEAFVAAKREAGRPVIILDGLLGVGAKGSLREPLAGTVLAINTLRKWEGAQVFAIDLPTGLPADSGKPGVPCVEADVTLAIGACKTGLIADSATNVVGRLSLVYLDELSNESLPGDDLATLETTASATTLAGLLPRRSFEMNKGECGRISVVAGSLGLTGAARLCSEACVRAGAGLVTLYVPEDAYPIVAAGTAPEVMVRGVSSYLDVLETRHDVLAIGPGLGQTRREEVLELLRRTEVPAVIDADALNILSGDLGLLTKHPAPRLLTPHPGEMARLDPGAKDRPRREVARSFTDKHGVTLLLKGARTVIAQAGEPLSYNTTGTPGMATGGMGDVLTGVCAALLGQKLSPYDAARVGAWICGRAGELAISHGAQSEESLTPVQLTEWLGAAFKALRARGY